MLKFNEVTSEEYYEHSLEGMGSRGYSDNIVTFKNLDIERLEEDTLNGEHSTINLLSSIKKTERGLYYTKMFYDRLFPYDNSYSSEDRYVNLDLKIVENELIDKSELYYKIVEKATEQIVLFSEKPKSINIQRDRISIRFVVNKRHKENLIYQIVKKIIDFPVRNIHIKYTEYTKDGYRKHYKGEFINWNEITHYRGTQEEVDFKIAQLQKINISKELVNVEINSNKELVDFYNEKTNSRKNKDLIKFVIIDVSKIDDYGLLRQVCLTVRKFSSRVFLVNNEDIEIPGEIRDNTSPLNID